MNFSLDFCQFCILYFQLCHRFIFWNDLLCELNIVIIDMFAFKSTVLLVTFHLLCFLFFFSFLFPFFFFFFFFFCFFGPPLLCLLVPVRGVELLLVLQACTTAAAVWDPSLICDLHHSSQNHWVLNALSEARDRTRILMNASWVC